MCRSGRLFFMKPQSARAQPRPNDAPPARIRKRPRCPGALVIPADTSPARRAAVRLDHETASCGAARREGCDAMNGVRVLLDGRGLVESPRGHGDRLYFSDWSAGEVVAVDLGGRSGVFAHGEALPLCTAVLPDR